ncbi:MAG: hypothetical protein HZB59_05730 [Ignavibacteriales bacterium]|nr:hypothetical protein [Ignavibacteriales bacterium]
MRFIATILLLLSVFCGCKKDPTSSNQNAVPVDPNKPNANKNIILEVKNGDYAMINVFTITLEGIDGNIILSGIVNNEYAILKVKKTENQFG